MTWISIAICLLAQPPADTEQGTGSLESVRAEYKSDASKYEFFADDAHEQPLELGPKPIMRWSSLKDYSGDVFVWTHRGVPAVIGCMLSGPNGAKGRNMSHEFHLLAEQPIVA